MAVDGGHAEVDPTGRREEPAAGFGRRHELTPGNEVVRLAFGRRSDGSHDATDGEFGRGEVEVDPVEVELDRQSAVAGSVVQLRQERRRRHVAPFQVRQDRLVHGPGADVTGGTRSLAPVPDVHERRRCEVAAQERVAGDGGDADLEPPDGRHELLLGVHVDQFRRRRSIGIGHDAPDDGIAVADQAIGDPCGSDRASDQPPIAASPWIEPAIELVGVVSGLPLLVLRLERRIVKVQRVVVHSGDRGLEPSGEMQSERVQVAHEGRRRG